ncbi:unnamed protein product [Clonostachys rosea f. rosea IK726]|uniref:Uncharacterized protein n=1 Tax=Clonostachys rosea f. rosea IK726 TaxID=1349383 RepID=A0ACA9U6G8_BIOOC|nr:unnamed protein product [Clonostachys rosea f. rosea IK726]
MQTYLCSRDDPISALLLRAESIVWFPRIPRVTENQHLPTVNNVAIGNRHPLPATEVDNDLRSIGAWSDGVEANIRAAEAAATRAASTSFPVVSAESPTTVERPIPPEESFFNETSI